MTTTEIRIVQWGGLFVAIVTVIVMAISGGNGSGRSEGSAPPPPDDEGRTGGNPPPPPPRQVTANVDTQTIGVGRSGSFLNGEVMVTVDSADPSGNAVIEFQAEGRVLQLALRRGNGTQPPGQFGINLTRVSPDGSQATFQVNRLRPY